MKIKKFKETLKDRISLKNFKKGLDEEQIFGPLCIVMFLVFLYLRISQRISLYTWSAIAVLLLYIFFVYFPYHRKPITIFAIFFFASSFVIIGFFSMYLNKVEFFQIRYMAYLWWIFLLITFTLEMLASKRYNIEHIDISLGYLKGKTGKWIVPILALISPIAFFMFAGSYYFFGGQHILLWLPIFIFWTISNARIIKYQVL